MQKFCIFYLKYLKNSGIFGKSGVIHRKKLDKQKE